MRKVFELTENHLKLARRANISWEHGEYGAPAMDCKRPYGNSDVERDIAEILGWDFDYDSDVDCQRCREIHEEMAFAVEIILQFAGESVKLGQYGKDYGDWVFLD